MQDLPALPASPYGQKSYFESLPQGVGNELGQFLKVSIPDITAQNAKF